MLEKEKHALTGKYRPRGGHEVGVIVRTVPFESHKCKLAIKAAGGYTQMKIQHAEGRTLLELVLGENFIIPAVVVVSHGVHFDPIIPQGGHLIVAESVHQRAPEPGVQADESFQVELEISFAVMKRDGKKKSPEGDDVTVCPYVEMN